MVDAIVIGAGLSGLVCARRLAEGGASVLVLEARTRVGGRLLSGIVGGRQVDLGGQWLTAGQDRLVALAAELGVSHSEHVRTGRAIVDEAGGMIMKVAAAFAQRRAIRTIETLMRTIPRGEPAAAAQAGVLDRMTLGDWLHEAVGNKLARERLRMHADLVFATDPADVSLLSYLSILGATGGFSPEGADIPGGGREHRLEGGAQRLAERIVEHIGERFGDLARIELGRPIVSIDAGPARVTVRTNTSEEHVGSRVILAIPPALVRRIAVELPPGHRTFVDGVRAGPVVKCFAAYPRPFWRERGLSGEAYLPHGTVRATVEIAGTPPALLAFIVGPRAARWAEREPADRRAEVLAVLAAHFGDEAERPLEYIEQNWAAETYSAGCVAATPPGVLARGGRWRDPVGRVHIAGTESAVLWPGYMDGAIEAGERAAAEVLAALR